MVKTLKIWLQLVVLENIFLQLSLEEIESLKSSYKKERIIEPLERKGLIKNLTKI